MVDRRAFIFGLVVISFLVPNSVKALGRKRYDNFHVYQINPQNQIQLTFLQCLEGQLNSYVFLNGLHYLDKKIYVLVAPENVLNFEQKLKEIEMHYELLEKDAQMELGNEEVAEPFQRGAVYNWKKYYTLNDTFAWLRSLAESYPGRASLFVAGKSFEGRELLGIKISNGSERKAIFIEGGIHAREWISPATTTFIINELLTSKDKKIRAAAENFDWYILPHVNPDGYVYTHTTDRLWRKTRTPYKKGCFGADPNRNWDFHWNEKGSNNNPCSDTYAGSKPFSDVEMRTFADYISQLKDKIFLYVAFHSFGQLLLFPYEHTPELPPNYSDLKRIFDAAVVGISRRYGTKYTGGNIYDAIYPASGSSVGWAYGVADIKYAFAYELRPLSNVWYGFKLSKEQIIPTAQEAMDSLIALVAEASDEVL